MKKLIACAGLALVLAACGSQPREPGTYLLDELEARKDIPDAGWDALKNALPPVPTVDSVLPIVPNASKVFRYGIDPRSISIAPGDMVRYTLLAASDRGAINISYETVRCNTREWRMVALYQPGAGWVRARNDDWQPYRADTVQKMLRSEVFCTGGGAAATTPAGLEYRLRHWEQYADGVSTGSMP